MSTVETERAALADKLEAVLTDAKHRLGTLEHCTHLTLLLAPSELAATIATLRAPAGGGSAGAEADGRALRDGLSSDDQAAARPDPAGFDPSRGWQPIATAPKEDEESILVCDARVAGGFHQVVWWYPESKHPGWHWDTSDGPTFHQDAFTHWMPLPPPPASGTEARKGRDEGSACEGLARREMPDTDPPGSPDADGGTEGRR